MLSEDNSSDVFIRRSNLLILYRKLFSSFGPQHWWPGEGSFEVMVGAILTQNTNWGNVKKAIDNLKKSKALQPIIINEMSDELLAELIRPAGYFNVKAKRLKSFTEFFINQYSGKVSLMNRADTDILRRELLKVKGIGPETADSIILYALERPSFVIDVYTKRVLSRHGFLEYSESYDNFQQLFHLSLHRDSNFFNEYHALFVRLGKEFCRPKPRCEGCPLSDMLP